MIHSAYSVAAGVAASDGPNNWSGNIGNTLTVGSIPIVVSQLGTYLDGATADFAVAKTVTLFNAANGTILGQVVINPGDIGSGAATKEGQEVYKAVSSFTVPASTTLALATYGYDSADKFETNQGPQVTLDGGAGLLIFTGGGTLSFGGTANSYPGNGAGGGHAANYASATMKYSAASTLSLAPATASAGGTVTITATGTNTAYTSATTFTVASGGSGASISNVVVASPTSATFSLSAGTGVGPLVISDGVDTATVAVTSGAFAFNGPLAVAANSPSIGITFTFPPAVGGTAPYHYQLFGAGAPFSSTAGLTPLVSGSTTSLTLANPTTGDQFYRVLATDSATTPASGFSVQSSNQTSYLAAWVSIQINVVDCGDSIEFGAYSGTPPSQYFGPLLQAAFPTALVTLANVAVSGSTSGSWTDPAGANLAGALAAKVPGARNIAIVPLGTNDSKFSPSNPPEDPSVYGANMATIAAHLLADAFDAVVLCPPMYLVPGAAGQWDEASLVALIGYRAALLALANGTTIFCGLPGAFDRSAAEVQAGQNIYVDGFGVHPGTTFDQSIAQDRFGTLCPIVATMLGQASYGNSGASTDPGSAFVASGHGYSINGVAKVGTFDPVTGKYTDPGASHVATGTTYQFAGQAVTGTFSGTGGGGGTAQSGDLFALLSPLIASGAFTGPALANVPRAGYSLAGAGLDPVTIETGINARQALSLVLAAEAGTITGNAAGSPVAKSPGTNITRIAATTSNGDRTATTCTPPA